MTAFEIQFREEAESDIIKITKWYDEINSDLGSKFLEELYEALDFIVIHPEACYGSLYYSRIKPLKKFPYVVIFKIEKNAVVVFAVLHIKQNKEDISTRMI